MAPQQSSTARPHKGAGVKARKGISARSRDVHHSHLAVRPRYRPPTRPEVNRLPNELLEIIFLLSLPSSLADPTPGSGQEFVAYMRRAEVRDYPNLLGCVCRRWRAIALASRALHSYIFLDLDMHDISYEKKRAAGAYYGAFLACSGTLPLTMSIDASAQEKLRQLLGAPFVAHLPRLRRVCIAIEDGIPTFGPFSVLPLFPNVRTPLLETVRLDVCSRENDWKAKNVVAYFARVGAAAEDLVQPDLRILHHAPKLSSFSLDDFGDTSFAHRLLQKAGLDFGGLTCLRLPEVPCCAPEIYKLVVDLPRLSSLRCAVRDGYEAPPRLDQLTSDGLPLEEFVNDQNESRSHNVQARRRRTALGELVLPDLVDLHITLVSNGFHTNAPRSNAFKRLLDMLILPCLATFAVSRRRIYGADFDWDEMDDPRMEELNSVLVHPLQSLMARSGCAIRHLALDAPRTDDGDVSRVLRALPTVTSLKLDAMACAGPNGERLLQDLTRRRAGAGSPDLLPHLRHLVIGNRKCSEDWQPSLPAILDMVEARWPVGWSACAIACVSVVLVQKRCGWNKITYDAQYEELPADVQERLQRIRSRGDIDLCIEQVRRDE
ncbi:uncharacterized protein SCHCODRAFT_02552688 [Schizophyllum commune H4-8]|nr:uncharacterized protein SCHCODRAFT_02552688 [Schizophyllum commune H4-8]KAI5887617.1 hypothetical protein SCHCODRAFT_02552688 [Schizophyllum commune H4-8]